MDVKRYGAIYSMVEVTPELLANHPSMDIYVCGKDFDRVTAERDTLQQLLSARDEENSDLLEENRLMTNANAACGQELVRLRAKLTEYQSLLGVSSELLKTISMHTAMSPSQWCESFQREVKDRIQKVDSALENQA